MNANDIISITGIIVLGLIGVYFSLKIKQDEKNNFVK